MSLEQFKTQVLLLHSQQSTLDTLSAGFTDRYSVHCATSGTEALNTLGDTPIHVIVSAQDLPGMSGLEALREAKKRSPDTIGILLAGTDKQDGLEALVGDQEVFQIVRGSISPQALIELIESANKRVRMMALAESANDQRANVDEPVTEHIVMETSANGSTIISDGTGSVPALRPDKIGLAASVGGREVDVLVLTKDEEFLGTVKDSARGLHDVYHAVTQSQAQDIVQKNKVGVLVTDAAMADSSVESLTHSLRQHSPRMVAIVAGRRDDGELLMDLINRGHVYRFLLKPVSPGRARLAIEASVKHHMEAPDDAFKPRNNAPGGAAKSKPAAKVAPKAKAAPRAQVATAAKTAPKPAPKPQIKKAPAPAPVARPQAKSKPKKRTKIEPTLRATAPDPMSATQSRPTPSMHPIDNDLDHAFGETNSFTETMTGIAMSVGKSISGATDNVSGGAHDMLDSVGGMSEGNAKPKMLAIGGGALAVVALVAWLMLGDEPETEIPSTAQIGEPNQSPVADRNTAAPAPAGNAQTNPAPATAPPAVPSAVQTANPPANDADLGIMLARARAARDAGNLLTPAGDSAVERYVEALAVTGDDPTVVAELNEVVGQVLGVAESAILDRDVAGAESALAMARFADPNNSRLTFLDAQLIGLQLRELADQARLSIRDARYEDAANLIAQARRVAGSDSTEIALLTSELNAARGQQQIGATIALANERLDAGNLVAPANDNARYYFDLALASDSENLAAQQGLVMIAGKLVLQARAAMDNGQLDNAEALLNDARSIDPSSSDLNASAVALGNARQELVDQEAQATRQAELTRQSELEQQAEAARIAEAERQADVERQAAADALAAEARAATAAATLAPPQQQANDATSTADPTSTAPSGTEESGAPQAAPAQPNAAPVAVATEAPQTQTPVSTPPDRSAVVDGVATTFGLGSNNAASNTPTQQATNQSVPVQRAAAAPAAAPDPGPVETETVSISRLTRTNYVAAEYPRSAQRRDVSGSVDLRFTVTTDGRVRNLSIAQSKPGDTFDEAAIEAVEQWRFEPVIENGVAVEKQTAVRLAFNLE